ncbi:MAG: hypothetical protein AAGA56_31500, partial [Myxococcota bacterium]
MVSILVYGCSGSISGPGGDPGPPPPPDVEPIVADVTETVTSEGTCLELGDGEILAGTSPEGHAWLLREQGAMTQLRVADPFAGQSPEGAELELAAPTRIAPRDATDGLILTEDVIWSLADGFSRTRITPPAAFSRDAQSCGDLPRGGYLLTGGQLYQLRGSSWWSFQPSDARGAVPNRLVSRQGECFGPDDVLWALADDGTVWRVKERAVEQPVRFAGIRHATALDSALTVIDGEGSMWMGDGTAWQPYDLGAIGIIDHLAGAAHQLWLVSSDSRLIRFDGDAFAEVSHDLRGEINALFAHAGGVWLSDGSRICHQSVDAGVRVDGLAPHRRATDKTYAFRVRAVAPLPLDPGAEIATAANVRETTATLDGEPIVLADDGGGWLRAEGAFAGPGWHVFVLAVDGQPVRELHTKVVPDTERSWAEDIEPIYATHCASSGCHEPGAT